MSFTPACREKYPSMTNWQMVGITRIIDLLNNDKTVIFLTFPMSAEGEAWFKTTLNQSLDFSRLIQQKRFYWVTLTRPPHFDENVSLAKVLLCNIIALQKISQYLEKGMSYILPAIAGADELELANTWRTPMLANEEVTSQLLHNHIKQRKVAISAEVLVPPALTTFEDELSIYQALAQLMDENPNVKRWVFKMNGQLRGRGIAYIDTHYFEEVEDESEIPDIVSSNIVLVDFKAWQTWSTYKSAFLDNGGLLEAGILGKEKMTAHCPVVHLMVQPDGELTVIGTSSVICIQPFKVWGALFPQASVSNSMLISESKKIGQYLFGTGYMGYLTCEFVAV